VAIEIFPTVYPVKAKLRQGKVGKEMGMGFEHAGHGARVDGLELRVAANAKDKGLAPPVPASFKKGTALVACRRRAFVAMLPPKQKGDGGDLVRGNYLLWQMKMGKMGEVMNSPLFPEIDYIKHK
jgi:hypothetical protein